MTRLFLAGRKPADCNYSCTHSERKCLKRHYCLFPLRGHSRILPCTDALLVARFAPQADLTGKQHSIIIPLHLLTPSATGLVHHKLSVNIHDRAVIQRNLVVLL
uniref:Uncharacterized protein n=1 Tax=Ascaris lumbricoides TaxID=6252 RepID=A0A0M3I0V8_ASCLU